MHRLFCVLALVGLAACNPGGLNTLNANQFKKSTKQGTDVELAHWAYWDNSCAAEDFDVFIDTAPANGKTEIRDDVFAIPSKTSSGADTGCVDKIIESKKVFYVPAEGFTGQDTVVVTFSGSSGDVTNAYTITVR